MPVNPANEFSRSLAKVLQSEGGYSDQKDDPGGPTMRGVTQRVQRLPSRSWLAD